MFQMVPENGLEPSRYHYHGIFFPLYVAIADFSLWAGLCLNHIYKQDLGWLRIVSTHSHVLWLVRRSQNIRRLEAIHSSGFPSWCSCKKWFISCKTIFSTLFFKEKIIF